MKVLKEIKKNFYRLRGQKKLRLKNKTMVKITPRFHISTNIEAEKIIEKDNEEALLKTFLREIRSGDIVFDIGANIGLYTLPAVLKLNGTGKVFAFEPVPIWFQRLKENITLNKLSPHHVVPFNVGFSYKNEICEMKIKGVLGSGMGSLSEKYRNLLDKRDEVSVSVQLVRGYDFIRKKKIPQPNVIKIDVEGAEHAVLLGLGKSLENTMCRFILCEIHPCFMTEPPEHVEKLLKKYGFHIQISEQQRTEYYLLARKDQQGKRET